MEIGRVCLCQSGDSGSLRPVPLRLNVEGVEQLALVVGMADRATIAGLCKLARCKISLTPSQIVVCLVFKALSV